jgi:Fungal specific transcription factor domain
MQNRIDRLEGLVLSLMTSGPQSAGAGTAAKALNAGSLTSGSMGQNIDPDLDGSLMEEDDEDGLADDSETDKVTKSFGVMKVDTEKQKTFYVGEAHWAALLNEISEVKNYFHLHKKELEAQMEKVAQTRKEAGQDIGAGPALLFGATIPPSRAEIFSQIPSRYMCDILISRYFNTYDPATHILHGPTFQKQYNTHWADSSKSSIVWVAMLFAMMRLAMLSYTREGDEPPEFRGKCKDLANTFRTQLAHCLISADYTKPHNFIIETLIFHLHAEYTCNRDAEASIWVLVGMIARLAMRMGYHRDSKAFPNITPFHGEMRRRIWSFVRQADILFSFQIALPSMIRTGDSDTELPRNIYDDEFNEDSPSLPPSRPDNEPTSISYLIHKSRLSFGFGRVLEEINGVYQKRYEEILKIDRGLHDIYESIPEHLKLRPMSEQTLAPVTLIMSRFSLATIYHKAQCVLHRRFMRSAKTSNRYVHSRRQCIDSAMQLLSFQAIQFAESGERGRMKSLRNYTNSLAAHDYLVAATVIAMDLYNNRDRGDFDANTPSTSVSGGSGSQSQRSTSVDGVYVPGLNYRREDLIRSLEQSRDIWISQRDISMEAYKASELLNVLLSSLSWQAGLPSQGDGQFSNGVAQSNGAVNDEQSAAITLNLLQSGGLTPNSAAAMAQQIQPQGQRGSNGMEYFSGGDSSFTGILGTANATSPMPVGVFGAVDNFGTGMNVDWVSNTYLKDEVIVLTNVTGGVGSIYATGKSLS